MKKMRKNILFPILIGFWSLALGFVAVFGSDLTSQAMGNMRIALPDSDTQINLYHIAGNTAWLQMNDARNWMTISSGTSNSWGELRRYWDPYGIHRNMLRFAGLKHLSPTQTFYGAIRYNVDVWSGVNRTIELEPYALDPFVLCDSTQGNFNYDGPKVVVAFNHRISKRLWWGVGLHYAIYRGLKKKYSMPEIIRRSIKSDFSLAFRANRHWILGLSFRPYDLRDLTKIVQQPDGTAPVIFRYRGEFEFTSVTSKDDRTAIYKGMEVVPQLMYHSRKLRGVVLTGYYYRWHEVYDNVHLRKYDGYYQGQQYFVTTAWRWLWGMQAQNALSLRYNFRYIQDWAEEPLRKFAFYRSFQRLHEVTVGYAQTMGLLTAAFEGAYRYYLPDKKDYLAHIHRRAPIKTLTLHAGGNFHLGSNWNVQAGLSWHSYSEPLIWHYFGDYHGVSATAGVSYIFKKYRIEFYAKSGQWKGDTRKRQILDVSLRLKQYLD